MTYANWTARGAANGWILQPSSALKRLPGIRHARAAIAARNVTRRHQDDCGSVILPEQFDAWLIEGIAKGYDRQRG